MKKIDFFWTFIDYIVFIPITVFGHLVLLLFLLDLSNTALFYILVIVLFVITHFIRKKRPESFFDTGSFSSELSYLGVCSSFVFLLMSMAQSYGVRLGYFIILPFGSVFNLHNFTNMLTTVVISLLLGLLYYTLIIFGPLVLYFVVMLRLKGRKFSDLERNIILGCTLIILIYTISVITYTTLWDNNVFDGLFDIIINNQFIRTLANMVIGLPVILLVGILFIGSKRRKHTQQI